MEKDTLIKFFEKAIENKSSAEVEMALTLCFSNAENDYFEKYLSELLCYDWHFMHEDIVLLLQEIGSIKSVQPLFKASTKKFKYLDYNDSKAFARKCTWALADIGNTEAKEALIKLSTNEDTEIAEYAKKRIENWNREADRKRHFS